MCWFILLSFLASQTLEAQPKETIMVATYRYSDNDRIRNIESFAHHFASSCGCSVSVKSYESVGAMLEGMDQGEPGVVLMNTLGYLLLREKNEKYQPVAALRVAPGKKSTYQSILIANKKTGITTLEQLKIKSASMSLLLVNPGSTSGNLVPRLGLASIGITDAEQQFKEVAYSKNHALTLKQVAQGIADVGAFGSEEYDKLKKAEPSLAEQVNVLWSSGDIPLGPVVVRKGLSEKLRGCLENTLIKLEEENPAALQLVKEGWTEAIPADRYVRIKDSDYEAWLKESGDLPVAMKIIKKFAN
jgi:phosphate/phosphite/phosphonate ABC transporter binding protein